MKKEVEIEYLSDNIQYTVSIELASLCPRCGNAIHPAVVYGLMVDHEDNYSNTAYLLNLCSACNECFVSKHVHEADTNDDYILHSVAPIAQNKQNFSKNIVTLSPDFVQIYNDSFYAEQLGLTSICGMGYRKALEFLVKDYIISRNPDSKGIVSSKMLAACIKDHISDERLKTLAKASTWIGNDETHYIRKHEHLNYKNLKIFINAFVTFIDAELAYDEAEKLTSSK